VPKGQRRKGATPSPRDHQQVEADGERREDTDLPGSGRGDAGWSLRASGYGEGDLFTIQGLMIPFAATEAEISQTGLARPSRSGFPDLLETFPDGAI
jgi:hypothetical protein